MRKKLLLITASFALLGQVNAQRFLNEVFSTYTKTANITYATNFSFLTGAPTSTPIMMDVYEPAGMTDTMAKRPLIIFMHEGSFLPAICVNQQPIGSRNDSANVEMCIRFAKRGYVVANIDYRLGWNPAGSNVDIRRGTLLNAVYRAIQDVKGCVRYFRADAGGANTYKIDSNKIVVGGAATGGTIALNYACLNTPAQIQLPKFISSITDATYGFTAGQPYVNQAALGDFDGYGGLGTLNNPNNSVGHNGNAQFVFSLGGILGDSSWLTPGVAPIVGMHEVTNPFAPYGNGIVYVPGTPPQSVVDVSGAGTYMVKGNAVGNDDCYKNAGYNDVYTLKANTMNGGVDGLYPFLAASASSSPWDWFDSASTVAVAVGCGLSVGAADTMYANALLTNPDMSKTKAMRYIDTIMGYLNPRIAICLNLVPGLGVSKPVIANIVNIYPNPATSSFEISSESQNIQAVILRDITGRVVKQAVNINAKNITMPRGTLVQGVYFVTITVANESITRKLIIE